MIMTRQKAREIEGVLKNDIKYTRDLPLRTLVTVKIKNNF